MQINLTSGVVPISSAASKLAKLLKQAKERKEPVIVTQKGAPTGVLLSVEVYTALVERAESQ